jgi:hypothetical protein
LLRELNPLSIAVDGAGEAALSLWVSEYEVLANPDS